MFPKKSFPFSQKIYDEFPSFIYYSVARLLDLFTRFASTPLLSTLRPKWLFPKNLTIALKCACTIAAQTPGIVNLLRSRDKCSVHFARMLALSVNELELQRGRPNIMIIPTDSTLHNDHMCHHVASHATTCFWTFTCRDIINQANCNNMKITTKTWDLFYTHNNRKQNDVL